MCLYVECCCRDLLGETNRTRFLLHSVFQVTLKVASADTPFLKEEQIWR